MAWGGPIAQIAMLRRELVESERWISGERFNRALALYQVLPGPEAHEMCVFLGTVARGRLGGLLAGAGFMLPGFALMLAFSALYVSAEVERPLLEAISAGVQPAVLALIALGAYRIGRSVVADVRLAVIVVVTFALSIAGVPFWMTLPAAGLTHVLAAGRRLMVLVAIAVGALAAAFALAGWLGSPGPGPSALSPSSSAPVTQAHLPELFWSGLAAGMLSFGGAYTAIPLVRSDAVGRGWMSDAQFLDGLALSGMLPAPLIIFATFVGYVGAGLAGALVMTAGVFLPAFCMSLFFHERIEKLIDEPRIRAFLDGVVAGVVGLIAGTLIELARSALGDTARWLPPVAVFCASLLVLALWRAKPAVPLVILAAAATGFLLRSGP